MLILSDSMIKENSDLFLDDTTICEVEEALGVKIIMTKNNGRDFVDSLLI